MMASIEVYDPKKSASASAPSKHIVTPPENPLAEGGPIHLTDQQGLAWRGEDSAADLLLVSFGYTRCQGACPRTLVLLDEAMALLKDSPKRVQPLLVSIDPERDTPASLRDYADSARSGLVALTGDSSDVTRVAKSFGVAVKKQLNAQDGSYSMSHSTDLFLATRDGRIVRRFELITPAAEIAAQIQQALESPTPPPPPVVTANIGRLP
jgi:protein SCO1/2